MNDRRDRDSKLLAGAFHGDWADGAPAQFAKAAAAHARRRRATRHALMAASAACVLVVAGFVATHRPVPSALPIAAQVAQPAYEIISDAQLLAALKDSPVLVVKKADGTNEITLLEPPAETLPPTRSE